MGTANTPSRVPYEQETDEDLLTFIAMSEDDRAVAEDAFEVFYKRHLLYLYGRCNRHLGLPRDKGPVEDLVSDTFNRVFQKAGTFRAKPGSSRNEITAQVRAWMSKIARNLFLSSFASPKLVETQLEDEMAIVTNGKRNGQPMVLLTSPTYRNSPYTAAVIEALKQLPEREREVLIVSFNYYDFEKHEVRLPDADVKDLAKRFDTTPTHIRQIRKRAIAEVERILRTTRTETNSKKRE